MTERGEHLSALLMLSYTVCQKTRVGLANSNIEVKRVVKTMKTPTYAEQ